MKRVTPNGEIVKQLREQLERLSTQKEMANEIGVSVRMLRKIENVNTPIMIPILDRLAKALNVHRDHIIFAMDLPKLVDTKVIDSAGVLAIFDSDEEKVISRYDYDIAEATSDEGRLYTEATRSNDIACIIEVTLTEETGGYVFHPGRSHRPSPFCIFHGTFGPEGHSGGRSMLIHLHSQATTTPKVRAEIQASDEPAWVLAERYGTTEQTVWKWRKRDSVHDRSHTAHRLQTTLTPAQEAVAVALRKTLLVSLDDLLAVVREFLNPDASRSGLDRCLRRHGVGNLRDLKVKSARPRHSGFKAYEPGYVHIDVKYLPQMADETSRRYLFVAIDRATRWVFIRIYNSKTAANARRFLRDLERACPMRIRTILTDNGKEFTDRLFGLRKRAATGGHEFDKLCSELGIEHRLTPPRSPQTNGMVERFNGRIEDVLQSHHFRSGEELETTLHRYAWLYNQQLPQSALGSKSPLQAMKDWHKLKPELFKKQPYYRTGCDSYAQALFDILGGLTWSQRNILEEIPPSEEIMLRRRIRQLLVLLKGNDVWTYQTSVMRTLPERHTIPPEDEPCTHETRFVVALGPPGDYGETSMRVPIDHGQPFILKSWKSFAAKGSAS